VEYEEYIPVPFPPAPARIIEQGCKAGDAECPNACKCECGEGAYVCRCYPDLPEFGDEE
jgi:hypothetical protein